MKPKQKLCLIERNKLPVIIETEDIEKYLASIECITTVYDVFVTEYPENDRVIFIGYGIDESLVDNNKIMLNRLHYCPALRSSDIVYGGFVEDHVLAMKMKNNKYAGLSPQDIDDLLFVYNKHSLLAPEEIGPVTYMPPDAQECRVRIYEEIRIWLDDGIESITNDFSNDQLAFLRNIIQGDLPASEDDIFSELLQHGVTENEAERITEILCGRFQHIYP